MLTREDIISFLGKLQRLDQCQHSVHWNGGIVPAKDKASMTVPFYRFFNSMILEHAGFSPDQNTINLGKQVANDLCHRNAHVGFASCDRLDPENATIVGLGV